MYPDAGQNTREYYEQFLANPAEDLIMIDNVPSKHAVVSDHVGTPCGESDGRLYIENCGFNR